VRDLIDQPVRVRTTVDLPRDLLARSKSVVDRGLAKNQNTLFTTALADYLDQLDEQAIDRQFASMVADPSYQELNIHVLQEFVASDRPATVLREEVPARGNVK
jgi:hypothetical protein